MYTKGRREGATIVCKVSFLIAWIGLMYLERLLGSFDIGLCLLQRTCSVG
ncbi:hypothetical protein CsSME_00035924 [Camellia sinensis var. sinensis]